MAQNARTSARRDRLSTVGAQSGKMLCDLRPARGHQHLAIWLEKMIDAVPLVGDQAGAGTDGFEHARWRREAVARHAVAIDVQRSETGAEKRVVVAGPDMPDLVQIGWRVFRVPPRSTKHECLVRQSAGDIDKEPLDALLAIREAVCQQAQIAGEVRIGRRRKVRGGVERIVDRHAVSRADTAISGYDGIAAAISQNHVIRPDRMAQMM